MQSPTYLAKPLILILYKEPRLPDGVYKELESQFWPIDFKGKAHPFDITNYYQPEFGSGLFRHFISFDALISPEELPKGKWKSYTMEKKQTEKQSRLYNLDFGYLDTDKLVLASFKRSVFKIYQAQKVYADMLMTYAKGNFEATHWAFADFKDNRYNEDLIVIREKLKASLRKNKEVAHVS